MANIRQAVMSMHAYASDHDGQLPANIKQAEAYFTSSDILRSPFDHETQLFFDETSEPGWYQFGSYWFLSSADLSFNAATPSDTIIAYRTPRLDDEYYIAGFFDGSALSLTSDAFQEQMQQQDKALRQ